MSPCWRSKCTAGISESGKSDLDNASPVSPRSVTPSLRVHCEREMLQKWENGSFFPQGVHAANLTMLLDARGKC